MSLSASVWLQPILILRGEKTKEKEKKWVVWLVSYKSLILHTVMVLFKLVKVHDIHKEVTTLQLLNVKQTQYHQSQNSRNLYALWGFKFNGEYLVVILQVFKV